MNVPKIIHQIWIGDKPMPINALNSVKNMNTDYEYMFWCEKTIKEKLDIPREYRRKINHHSEIWGKADLYRWFILEKYGGIFIDADMVSIEPLDEFLLNKSFFSWENEMMRPDLCATSIQAYTPHHIIPKKAIDWILNNEIRSEKLNVPSWQLVGPGLLTRIYHSLEDKSVVQVFPSYYFLPDHHTGYKYLGHGKVYMTHEWGSTKNNYNEINVMKIPKHHTQPEKSIDITIPDDTKLIKEVMNGLKKLEGHFNININCDIDLDKYLKSMRNVKQIKSSNTEETLTEIMNYYGSDKGKGRHDYTIEYEKIFDKIKDEVKSFCEVGLGTTNPNIKSNMGKHGKPLASIYGWKKYFNKAHIYGGDIDADILKQGERFSTFQIDMTNPDSIKDFWNNIPEVVDIMLDDGLHEFDANVCLFENSIDMWRDIYIIEDIGKKYFEMWDKKIEEWEIKYPQFEFKKVYKKLLNNGYDNNLIIITNKNEEDKYAIMDNNREK